jgi:hypothetical protein
MTTVTLNREQRDGLYEFVVGHLRADSLSHLVQAKNVEAVKALAASLPICIRLLDQIGWEENGRATSYEVPLDAEVNRLLPELAARIEGATRDDEGAVRDASCSSDEVTARRFLRHDRHAFDAVMLMRAVA